MIRAIIFDCFGVLVGRGFGETYRLAGGDPLADADFIEDMLGQANLGLISADTFRDQVAAKLHITAGDLDAAMRQAEQPNTELLTYIDELHNAYKTAVLSNANVGTLEHKLGRDILDTTFDSLVVSAEVGLIKPEPEIYRLAAERLDVDPSECVFIDDQPRYCAGAEAVGMRSIYYQNLDQLKHDLKINLAK